MDNKEKLERIDRYASVIRQQTGHTIGGYREDGYANAMNKYGTSLDSSDQYSFVSDGEVSDDTLMLNYEENGLFSRIIDTPAEEAIIHGFSLPGLSDKETSFALASLDELDWDAVASTAVKWARLFGGSIAVMLINDGRRLEEPVDWRNIKSIDDIRVYDRSIVQPDYGSMYTNDPIDPFRSRGSRLGTPELYNVHSMYGSFTIHESRLLIFQNGELPERSTTSVYRLWGIPEYVRLHRAIRDAATAHGNASKMLDRSVQAVYSMKNLSMELSTDDGERRVLKRLQTIDLARGLLNSIVIDAEGEDYNFRTFQFAGVSDVIDATCNFLSALTSIPQTILFGRSPAGLNATGKSDLEAYYNYVGQIQRRMLRGNLRYLLSVIFQAGVTTGEVERVPNITVQFNPLWSMSEMEKAEIELQKAQAQSQKALTIVSALQQDLITVQEAREQLRTQGVLSLQDDRQPVEVCARCGGSSEAAPTATKLPQDMSNEERKEINMRLEK